VTFYIDYVKLTGNEEADKFADVEWQMSDPDTSVTTMKLYYDRDKAGLNGTLFATLTLTDGLRSAPAAPPAVNANLSRRQTSALTPTLFLPLVMGSYHQSVSAHVTPGTPKRRRLAHTISMLVWTMATIIRCAGTAKHHWSSATNSALRA